MLSSCIFENSSLESPEFLKTSLHTSAIISCPISLLGFYMILFKTPKQMKTAKWYIFNVHLSIVLFDIALDVLSMPMFLFPTLGIIPFGLFQYAEVHTIIQLTLGFASLAFATFSILSLYESRFYAICEFPGKKFWKFWRHIWLCGHYVLHFFIVFVFYISVPDQEISRKKLIENIPCLPDDFKSAPIFVLADEIGFQAVLMITSVSIVTAEFFLFFFLLVQYISDKLKNHRVSQQSVEVQKTFLKALFLQTVVPLTSLIIPIIYFFYSIIFDYYNQAFNNIGLACMSTYGFVSTTVMIIVHRPYREAFLTMIGKTNKVKLIDVVTMKITRVDVLN